MILQLLPNSRFRDTNIILRLIIVGSVAAMLLSCGGGAKYHPDVFREKTSPSAANAININKASANELQQIPFIGEKTAQRIIEHRERYGPFRKTEHLLLVQGISDTKFRQITHLISVE